MGCAYIWRGLERQVAIEDGKGEFQTNICNRITNYNQYKRDRFRGKIRRRTSAFRPNS